MVHTGIQRGSRLYLLPEEAAYFVDRGEILLLVEEDEEEVDGGEPSAKRSKKGAGSGRGAPRSRRLRLLSLEESIDLVAASGVPPEVHMVYTKLSRAGYTLQRHPAIWIVPPTGTLPGQAAARGEAGAVAKVGAAAAEMDGASAPSKSVEAEEWDPDKWDAEEWDPDAWDAEEAAGSAATASAAVEAPAAPATLESLAAMEEAVASEAGGWEAWAAENHDEDDRDRQAWGEGELPKGGESALRVADGSSENDSPSSSTPVRAHWWSATAKTWPFSVVPPPSGSGGSQKRERVAALGEDLASAGHPPRGAMSSAPRKGDAGDEPAEAAQRSAAGDAAEASKGDASAATSGSDRVASARSASTRGQPWWAPLPWESEAHDRRGSCVVGAEARPRRASPTLVNPLRPAPLAPLYPAALSLWTMRSLFPRLRPMRRAGPGEVARARAYGPEGQLVREQGSKGQGVTERADVPFSGLTPKADATREHERRNEPQASASAASPSNSTPPPPVLFSPRSMVSVPSPLALHLDVWEPGNAFSRKAPGTPSFRVAVVPSSVSPNVGDLRALQALCGDGVPVKVATVIAGDIAFYGFNPVQLKQLPAWKR